MVRAFAVGGNCKSPIYGNPNFRSFGLSMTAHQAAMLALPTERERARMYGWEIRMLLMHYLDQGVSKTDLSRWFGINCCLIVGCFRHFSRRLIPSPTDHDRCAHSRCPIDMIFQG